MHPDIFSIGHFHIKAYGLALALSFFLGVWLSARRAEKQGLKSGDVVDLSFVILISAIIGSRLFYVVYHLEEFRGHWLDAVNPFQSSGEVGIAGLSMMGGVILALIAIMAYFIIKRVSPWQLLDAMAPSFMLGIAITRIGCFFNGCCFGLPSDSMFGVVFPPESMAGWIFPQQSILPTQLMSSVAGFVMFALLLILEKKKSFYGFTFWLTFAFYGAWRFIIDIFRYYEDSMIFLQFGEIAISRNQFLAICLVAISVGGFMYLKKSYEKSLQTDIT